MKNAETTATEQAATVADQAPQVAPEKATSKKRTSRQKGAARAKKSANAAPKKEAEPARRPAAKKAPAEPRTNKKAAVVALMKRAKGVSLAEIVEATGWQKHTVRGFVSILGSKGGEKIESEKNAAGERSYRIAK
jgi:hypothetical protein